LIFVPTRDVNGFPRANLVNASVVWSLMFEMIFYLLLPLMFFLFKGYRIFIYMALAGAVSWTLARHGFAAFTPALVRARPLPFAAFALNTVFGFGFGIGMLVAVLYARCPKHVWQVLKQRRLTPIPLFFLSAPVFFKVGLYSPAEFWLLAVVFVFIVAGNDFFGLLSSKGVFLLGSVSYSFYITHGIVLFVFSHLFNRWAPIRNLSPLPYWSLIGFVGIAALCFSTLLYWTVEQRFMKRSSALSLVAAAGRSGSLK
jgi:peptidoglycan/LPS O-acetylase OafA/YrhL